VNRNEWEETIERARCQEYYETDLRRIDDDAPIEEGENQ